jgi:predicted ATPase with chaperone activity
MHSPQYIPREPDSIEATGLSESTLEALILKILYFRGDIYGQELSSAIGLRFSVIEPIVEALKLAHHIQIKRSLGMGTIGAVLGLTESGRGRAREALESNQYAGPAPVPIQQYVEVVREQRPSEGWVTKESLARALSGMVLTKHVLSQFGPAVSSANSMLVYGKPGDGKTYLIESLNNLDSAPVFIPHAIECQGNIVQVFDPIYHHRLGDEEEVPVLAIAREAPHDRRWTKCRRPFIMSGGELGLDMLDLRYNTNSRIYEAPFQLKANNGIYLIDDFGRQRATPAEVLNRWIVPMERRVDYLTFLTGGKMTAPFETFLVFSTNLNPESLGDEAFLRRIQYKILLRGPARNEFVRIFEDICISKKLPCSRETLDFFIARHYEEGGKAFRRCHPRDVLTHALNLIHFEHLAYELTPEILDRAFESCFLQEEEQAVPAEAALVRTPSKPCVEYWEERTQDFTCFGRVAFFASCRDRGSGGYRDLEALRIYDAAELSGTLAALHARAFRDWLGMNLEQQSRDLSRYLSTPEGRAAFLSFNRRELTGILSPEDARPEERQLFNNDLTTVLLALSQRQGEAPAAAPIERIA